MANPLLCSVYHSNPFPDEKRSILFCGNFGYGVIKRGVEDIPAVEQVEKVGTQHTAVGRKSARRQI
jgi:hypothetical protein